MQIITNPWKLWASGDITLRRLVLKLAFAERLAYCRKAGPRTAELSMPFNALRGLNAMHTQNGADGGTRTRMTIRSRDFLTRYDFHRRRKRVVCGLDYPFTITAQSGLRCCPSSLYTFRQGEPQPAWLGIGMG
jgi:hypothetical protein